ncbi:aspartyl protease family protein [uncultured Thiothrix sp.]|uniref:aspartyl protease family protein n=1 Tax=uncultured Thiothrix sp. TaxID=223185 RepID=UPI00262B9035|nr:aspartyl protease family protein [uncultured Thiothrix sp.]
MLLLAACSRLPNPKIPEFQAGNVSAVPMQLLYTSDLGVLPAVPVIIAGRKTWWLVDTGSSHNLVSPRLARELHLSAAASSEVSTIAGKQLTGYYRLPMMQIGAVDLENQSAAAVNLGLVSAADGLVIEGVLGMPALNRLIVSLDFGRHTAIFSQYVPNYQQPHSLIPFRLVGGVPVASLNVVGGRTGEFILDTGNAGGLVMFPNYARREYRPGASLAFIEVEDLGGRVPTGLALLSDLHIGSWQTRQVPVSLPMHTQGFQHLDGSIGNAIFTGQTLTFDFPSQHLLLSASQDSDALPGQFGFLLAANNVIEVVLPNSPAARMGIQVGDSILEVNGQNTRDASSHRIWRILDEQAQTELKLARAGTIYGVNLERSYFLPPF